MPHPNPLLLSVSAVLRQIGKSHFSAQPRSGDQSGFPRVSGGRAPGEATIAPAQQNKRPARASSAVGESVGTGTDATTAGTNATPTGKFPTGTVAVTVLLAEFATSATVPRRIDSNSTPQTLIPCQEALHYGGTDSPQALLRLYGASYGYWCRRRRLWIRIHVPNLKPK
jgi:hypothetical protein